MELELAVETGRKITVLCDGKSLHSFDINMLIPHDGVEGRPPHPLEAPDVYGAAVYKALFPAGSIAQKALAAGPERILLVTTDDDLQAIPWEYVHGPQGFLVLDVPFVRGLQPEQCVDPPAFEAGLHIVAVSSNPIDRQIELLNIEGEWQRLVDVVRELPYAITLERTRPPTIDRLRSLLANQRQRVVHFMGHGGSGEEQAQLLFENERGGPQSISARDFYHAIRGSVFLVTRILPEPPDHLPHTGQYE